MPAPLVIYEIVGIVANTAASGVKADAAAQFFVPLEGNHSLAVPNALTFYVRTSLDPDTLLTATPRAVPDVDPTLPVDNLITLRRQLRENVFVDRLVAVGPAKRWSLYTLKGAPAYIGALAVEGAGARLSRRTWTLRYVADAAAAPTRIQRAAGRTTAAK